MRVCLGLHPLPGQMGASPIQAAFVHTDMLCALWPPDEGHSTSQTSMLRTTSAPAVSRLRGPFPPACPRSLGLPHLDRQPLTGPCSPPPL